MTEMRSLIFELRPESLAAEGLVAALEKRVAVLRARHQLTVAAHLGSEPELPLPLKETLYRSPRRRCTTRQALPTPATWTCD